MKRRDLLKVVGLAPMPGWFSGPPVSEASPARQDPPAVRHVRFGNATASSLDAVICTTDVTQARVRARDRGTGQHEVTSPAGEPDEYGYVGVSCQDLRPHTEYEYRPEVLVDDQWLSAGAWRGSLWTLPRSGQPLSKFRFLAGACITLNETEVRPFNRAQRRRPEFCLWSGDQNYANSTATSEDPHLAAWEQKFASVRGLHNMVERLVGWWEVSDHDSGEGGNHGVGNEATTFQQAAMRRQLPMQPEQVPGTRAYAFTYGRIHFVGPDFRTTKRSHHNVLPDDHPDKTALGVDQRDWLLDQIRTAHAAGFLVVLVSDAVWLGEDMGSKRDCWASYRFERGLIGDALADGPSMVLQFDFHCLLYAAAEHNPYGNCPVLGGAGLVAPFNNLRGDAVYDWILPALWGSQIRVFWDHDVEDVGTSFVWTAYANDAIDDKVLHSVALTWPSGVRP